MKFVKTMDTSDLIKASPYTRLFWTEYQLDSKRNDYNIALHHTIAGNLNLKKLSLSLNHLINNIILFDRHLVCIDDILYWKKNLTIAHLEIFDDISSEKAFIEKPFNLKIGPLYRFGIFKLSNDKYNFIIVLHHALIDASSYNVLLSLISRLYNSQQTPLINTSKQIEKIKKFNNFLEQKLELANKKRVNSFWHKMLRDSQAKNNISYLKIDQEGTGFYSFSINKSQLDLSILQELNTTLFTLLASIFGFMMSKYCDSQTIIIACPSNIKNIQNLIFGSQTNILLLPIKMKKDSTLKTLLDESNAFMNHCNDEYGYLPIAQILANSSISELNIILTEGGIKNTKLSFEGCNISINKEHTGHTLGSELMLEYYEDMDSINFNIKYNKSLFHSDYIRQISHGFCHLLQKMTHTDNIDKKLSTICLLDKPQYNKIVYAWNQTAKNMMKMRRYSPYLKNR